VVVAKVGTALSADWMRPSRQGSIYRCPKEKSNASEQKKVALSKQQSGADAPGQPRSAGFRKDVFMLAIADDQYPFAGTFTHHKVES
jgi:hypothetical protein